MRDYSDGGDVTLDAVSIFPHQWMSPSDGDGVTLDTVSTFPHQWMSHSDGGDVTLGIVSISPTNEWVILMVAM